MDGDGEGRPEGRGEGRNEREDFAEYVEYLREKYGEGGGADAEKVESKQEEPEDTPQKGMRGASEAELERNELDDFTSYVEHLRQTYGPEGGSKAEDPMLEANVKAEGETDDGAESGNRADVHRELAESQQPAEPTSTPKTEGDTKAEEAPTSEPKIESKLDPPQPDTELGADRKEANNPPRVDAPLEAGTLADGEAAPPSLEEAAEKEREPPRITPDLVERRLDSVVPVAHQSVEEGRRESSPAKLTAQEHIVLTAYGERDPKVNISKSTLEAYGVDRELNEERIVRFEMRKMGSGEEVTAFGQVHPSDGRVRLHAEHLGSSSFEMVKACSYDFDGFARDFGDHRPRQMRNVGFDLEQGHIFMNVDRDRFEFLEPKLAAYNGRAVLTGKVEGHDGRLRFTFDGKEVTARIRDDKPIRSFDAYKGQLFLHHSRDYRGDSGNLEARVITRLTCTAYEIPGRESIRFNMWRPTIERKSGMRFETGKLYDIRGEVKGIEFTVAHRPMEGQHIMAFITGEKVKELTPGEKYDVTITSVKERTASRVLGYESGPTLRFSKRFLESRGVDTRPSADGSRKVIEYRLQNTISGEQHAIFDKLSRGISHSMINIDRLGARTGDSYTFLTARTCGVKEYIEYFGRVKPRELENVEMFFRANKLSMMVDGKALPLRYCVVDARNLESVLRVGVVGAERELRFWFDGKRIKPKFGDSYPILNMKRTEEGVALAYLAAGRMIQALVPPAERENLRKLTAKEMGEMTRITSFTENGNRARAFFNTDLEMADYASSMLRGLRESRYLLTKGNIGEEACAGILSVIGWRERKRHPFGGQEVGCNSRGPDSLMEHEKVASPQLAEFKWWLNQVDAESQAEFGLKRFIEKKGPKLGELGIRGAFIACLDWNPRRTHGVMNLKRVWSID